MEISEGCFCIKGSYGVNIKLTEKAEIIQNDEKLRKHQMIFLKAPFLAQIEMKTDSSLITNKKISRILLKELSQRISFNSIF